MKTKHAHAAADSFPIIKGIKRVSIGFKNKKLTLEFVTEEFVRLEKSDF